MLDHVTPFFALFASILVLLPLGWHIRSRNVGTITLSLYLFFGNLDNFVNSVAWWSTAEDKAPGFCEVSKYEVQQKDSVRPSSLIIIPMSPCTRRHQASTCPVYCNPHLKPRNCTQIGEHRLNKTSQDQCIGTQKIDYYRSAHLCGTASPVRFLDDRQPDKSLWDHRASWLLAFSLTILGLGSAGSCAGSHSVLRFCSLQW